MLFLWLNEYCCRFIQVFEDSRIRGGGSNGRVRRGGRESIDAKRCGCLEQRGVGRRCDPGASKKCDRKQQSVVGRLTTQRAARTENSRAFLFFPVVVLVACSPPPSPSASRSRSCSSCSALRVPHYLSKLISLTRQQRNSYLPSLSLLLLRPLISGLPFLRSPSLAFFLQPNPSSTIVLVRPITKPIPPPLRINNLIINNLIINKWQLQ